MTNLLNWWSLQRLKLRAGDVASDTDHASKTQTATNLQRRVRTLQTVLQRSLGECNQHLEALARFAEHRSYRNRRWHLAKAWVATVIEVVLSFWFAATVMALPIAWAVALSAGITTVLTVGCVAVLSERCWHDNLIDRSVRTLNTIGYTALGVGTCSAAMLYLAGRAADGATVSLLLVCAPWLFALASLALPLASGAFRSCFAFLNQPAHLSRQVVETKERLALLAEIETQLQGVLPTRDPATGLHGNGHAWPESSSTAYISVSDPLTDRPQARARRRRVPGFIVLLTLLLATLRQASASTDCPIAIDNTTSGLRSDIDQVIDVLKEALPQAILTSPCDTVSVSWVDGAGRFAPRTTLQVPKSPVVSDCATAKAPEPEGIARAFQVFKGFGNEAQSKARAQCEENNDALQRAHAAVVGVFARRLAQLLTVTPPLDDSNSRVVDLLASVLEHEPPLLIVVSDGEDTEYKAIPRFAIAEKTTVLLILVRPEKGGVVAARTIEANWRRSNARLRLVRAPELTPISLSQLIAQDATISALVRP